MKKVEYLTPNRMKIDTGWREFDLKVGTLMPGNVVGDGQYSSYVRPFNLTKNPVGQTVAPGHLQDFDLQHFTDLPAEVLAFVREAARDESVILYEIFHYNRSGKRVRHGYLVTAGHDGDHALLAKFYGEKPKSKRVLDVAAEYLSNLPETPSPFAPTPRARPSALAERLAA